MKNEISLKLNYKELKTIMFALNDATRELEKTYGGFKNIADQKLYPLSYSNYTEYEKLNNQLQKCFEEYLWGEEDVIK